MPQYAAAPAPSFPLHAHRPEPIEPPTTPPDPDEPDTIPGPTPDPIEPFEPVAPPIGDPPPQPVQTPQADARTAQYQRLFWKKSFVAASASRH
ncbi:hypothetical protein [Paraburkholderia susongensis]|uniref:Uncharacterized protein n=1 Tax=Paraburkholderia susongensis TaxID=1515439 RepID=A0A1X7KWY1_9BURK|nr:hypothetical protein [Paraburkholderia susongensis]SMG46128.1 hypothetical protein SAMN06265784_104498 [Paraburkholderia susongensis]